MGQFLEELRFILISTLNNAPGLLEGLGVSSWLDVSLTPASCKEKMLEAPISAGDARINLTMG